MRHLPVLSLGRAWWFKARADTLEASALAAAVAVPIVRALSRLPRGEFHARHRPREQGEKSRPRLLGRTGHVDHPEVAAGDLWLRGHDLHRRSRPGRGAGTRPA